MEENYVKDDEVNNNVAKKRRKTVGEEVKISDESEDDEEYQDEFYEGVTNSDGEPHGRGTLYFDNSRETSFQGHFVNGVKEGRGCFFFADGSSLKGIFQDDMLEGEGIYTYEDGSYMVGYYKQGALDGYTKEFDCNQRLTFEGNYRENVRSGICHFYIEYGGHLFGCVNKEGKLSGKDVVYNYGDGQTFLKGTFKDGEMIAAQEAVYDGIGDTSNPHSYKKVKESFPYTRDIATATRISTHPMTEDPFEVKRVCVKKSDISDAGEGLFSLISASPHEVMSFYNGIHITHEEVDGRDWKYNDNTISLNNETVIDVPSQYSSMKTYCASLGHKANHSFEPNCEYGRFNHPRFGPIKCIRTIQHVKPGDELTVAYGYDHTKLDTDAPDWYRKKLKEWSSSTDKTPVHQNEG